jgi:carboxyl-terminal processing protease
MTNPLRLALAIALVGLLTLPTRSETEYISDFHWLTTQIEQRYAYLADRHVDMARLQALYMPHVETVQTRDEWIAVLEDVLSELHDCHATLGTHTAHSPQLIPTGADMWGDMVDGRATLVEVRSDSPAERAGIRAGDEVLSVDGEPVAAAIARHMPHTLSQPDPQAAGWALRTALAGRRDTPRVMTLRRAGQVTLPPFVPSYSSEPLVWHWLEARRIGYIRFDNSLGDQSTVAAFDAALEDLRAAEGLVLDLRNTPSGGNTSVAEPMMGRLIHTEAPYQRFLVSKAMLDTPLPFVAPAPDPNRVYFDKHVRPRGPFTYTGPVVVLVDHWTGSMGEGMAIGLDAMHRATVVGTRMAGLCGATEDFVLPNTKIDVDLPAGRTYHLDGRPRETFVPPVPVDMATAAGEDPILERGLRCLKVDGP